MQVAPSFTEKPVFFDSRGKRLFGILHKAENNTRNVGVVFLNAGLQYRVGPRRIYVKIARRLSKLGFPAFRLDFPGIGDSEGVIKDFHFDRSDISDTLQAIDILTQETKIEKVVLLGICSGARDAIKAAAKDLRVDAVILWSLPIITDVRNNVISSVCANNYLKGWIKRSFSIKAWKRFLSHNNSSPSVRSVLWKLLTGRKIDEDNKYGEFFESFESFISSRRKALFVYGERDEVVLEEFQVKFEGLSEGNRNNCEYYVVPNGDHTFTSIEAEGNVIEKTVKWLTQKYELNMEMLEE